MKMSERNVEESSAEAMSETNTADQPYDFANNATSCCPSAAPTDAEPSMIPVTVEIELYFTPRSEATAELIKLYAELENMPQNINSNILRRPADDN
mmetsp:Transcript_4041/g.6571  ORF Transcript_4041/g.6571 Transcript_4041/m.6571 type:complete len:96 (+) Transcript_4041:99-386(+)